MAGYRQRFKRSWKFIVAILTPIIALPILFANDNELIPVPDMAYKASTFEDAGSDIIFKESPKFKLAYIILIMAVYWSFEILPLPVTALFPLVMFPLFGIDNAANVSQSYMKESNTIFLGGAIVALAVEYCNLHRRLALRLITIVGVSPKRLMFGLMVVVSFLSMWLSNTTCVTMIVPIIVAIVDEIHDVADATTANSNIQNQTEPNKSATLQPIPYSPRMRHSSVFANRGFSPHHDQENNNSKNVVSERGTLGLLEGHRSSKKQNADQSVSIPEKNNNMDSKKAFEQLPISFIKNELDSQSFESAKTDLNVDQEDGFCGDFKKPSITSLVEPERLESMMDDASSSNLECEDGLDRKRIREKEKWRRIKNMYLFAMAYAASIGGTVTITGTGPNKVFKEVIKPYSREISQDGKYLGMTFFTWMAFNFPPMLINIVIAWSYLTFKYCGLPKLRSKKDSAEHALRKWKEHHVKRYIQEEYKKLGKMTFHEIGVATIFVLVVLLWILRDPQFFQGWDKAISDKHTGDSTAALLGAVLLFIIPRNWSFLTSKDGAVLEALLDWKFVTQKLPWGVLLLLGSGYAIGDSAVRTGFSKWIGQELFLLHDLPKPLLLLIVMLITALISEVVSNTAAASVILPLLLGLSREMNVHPLYMSVGAAVTSSYAFMLPIASPVNAIIFAAGDFSVWEMVANGYILSIVCVFVFYINTLTLGEHMFNYSEFTYLLPPTTSPPINLSSLSSTSAIFNGTTY